MADPTNETRMLRVIGIDFGTSSIYMNVKRYNPDDPSQDSFNYIPVAFEHGESKGSLISVIRENSDGSFDFGRVANEEADGAVIYRNFKMNLESMDDSAREKSRQLVRELFRYLHKIYEQQINQLGEKEDAVETNISYPVKWQKSTAEFMIAAAEEAGFENVTGMDEATAAMTTVITRNFENLNSSKMLSADKPGYILLVDMGAGTTDCALCRYSFDNSREGQGNAESLKVDIITCWPVGENDPTFGGSEIDAVLAKYVEDFLRGILAPELQTYVSNLVQVGNNVKLWKENNVSANLSRNKPVTVCGFIRAYLGTAGVKFPEITRESFEELIKEKLRDYVYLIRGCLEKAGSVSPEFREQGLDLVVLAGGHSSWYFAKDIIDGSMAGYLDHPSLAKIRKDPSRVFRLPNPQSTVVLGLVYHRLLSTITLEKTDLINESWVQLLKNAAPNPEFFSDQQSPGEDLAVFELVQDFTRSFDFELEGDMVNYVSIDHSNIWVDRLFRDKRFFRGKNQNICLCVLKSFGSTHGFAVTSYGIYFESLLSKGCISWPAFIRANIHQSGWNNDKLYIDYTVLPMYRSCVPSLFGYFQWLQEYLRVHFGNSVNRFKLPYTAGTPDA